MSGESLDKVYPGALSIATLRKCSELFTDTFPVYRVSRIFEFFAQKQVPQKHSPSERSKP